MRVVTQEAARVCREHDIKVLVLQTNNSFSSVLFLCANFCSKYSQTGSLTMQAENHLIAYMACLLEVAASGSSEKPGLTDKMEPQQVGPLQQLMCAGKIVASCMRPRTWLAQIGKVSTCTCVFTHTDWLSLVHGVHTLGACLFQLVLILPVMSVRQHTYVGYHQSVCSFFTCK